MEEGEQVHQATVRPVNPGYPDGPLYAVDCSCGYQSGSGRRGWAENMVLMHKLHAERNEEDV